MKLTSDEAHDRIVAAVHDDGTVDEQWGNEESGLWGHYAGYDNFDPTGDLRYLASLRDSADLMLGRAAPSVSASDGAGGSMTADQWSQHLRAIRNQAADDYKTRVEAIAKARGGLQIAQIDTYSLTPILAGSRLPDPASPAYLGDPRYRNYPGRERPW